MKRFPGTSTPARPRSDTSSDSEDANSDPHKPIIQKFNIALMFNPQPNVHACELTMTQTELQRLWSADPLQEHLCAMTFENCVVHKVSLLNRSTRTNFNGQLKIFDNRQTRLYNSVGIIGDEEDGAPLWGDRTVRVIYQNRQKPTKAQLAYANFDVKSLEERVTVAEYELPREKKDAVRRTAKKGAGHKGEKVKVANIPKDFAPYFTYALRDTFSPDFINAEAHQVPNMRHLFSLHYDDYKKVLEAYSEKKKTIRTHDLRSIKFMLLTYGRTSDASLEPGPHFFQLEFEVWMPLKDTNEWREADSSSDEEEDDRAGSESESDSSR